MIDIKTNEEIKILKEGGKILSNIIRILGEQVKPGVTAIQLEKMACNMIEEAGGRPSFKYYKTSPEADPFPTALCFSVNNGVVHGPANTNKALREGDIVSLDIGMEYPYSKNGFGLYTDMARTFPVGKISKEASRLIEVTKKSFDLALKQIKPGNTVNDIGRAIEDYVNEKGYSVVRDLVGHGVGRAVHEEPQIPHYYAGKHYDIKLEAGMVIAVEPMVNIGSWEIDVAEDGFTFETRDGSLSSHHENTIVITKNGCELITK